MRVSVGGIMGEQRVLILGVGNILLSDEGFGVVALERLKRDYVWPDHVRFLDGGTQGLMLMDALMACDSVVVLDVALLGQTPGTICMLEGEALRQSLSFKNSLHQMDLADTLVTCHMIGHPVEAVVFAFQPFDIETMQYGLTPEAQEYLPAFCRKVVEHLHNRGLAHALPRP